MHSWFTITLLGLVAAVGYGIAHDNITARVCVEYFTIGHPRIFGPTDDPTTLALGWGIVATWWVGLPLGLVLAATSRLGSAPKLGARDLLRPVAVLLLTMGLLALGAGLAGSYAASRGWVFLTGDLADAVPAAKHQAFLADLWAHLMSYASAVVGAGVLAVSVARRRARLARTQLTTSLPISAVVGAGVLAVSVARRRARLARTQLTTSLPILPQVMAVIAERRANPDVGQSYVASLIAGGVPKIGAKITEEAAEVVEAAAEPGLEGRAHLVREVADLVFHSLVLLGHRDVAWEEVEAELARRFGVSGHAEKASRPPSSKI